MAWNSLNRLRRRLATRIRKTVATRMRSWAHSQPLGTDLTGPVVTWPPINDIRILEDVAPRLFWALPSSESASTPVHISITSKLRDVTLEDLRPASYLRPSGIGTAALALTVVKNMDEIRRASMIVLWKGLSLWNLRLPHNTNKAILDPYLDSFVEMEGWNRFIQFTQPSALRNELNAEAVNNFTRFLQRYSFSHKINLFGKGPSIQDIYRHRFDGDINIVCNSIIRSRQMLQHIRPAAITCADAVHHFGPSLYAEAFREDLVQAVLDHDCYLFLPAGAPHYLLAMRNPRIRDRIIGLGGTAVRNIPTAESPAVQPLPNILTWMMLPVSLSLRPSSIQLWGFDGKSVGKEAQAWQRERTVEYEDLESTVMKAHPAYFRDALHDHYYDMHCRQVEEFIEYAEAAGVAVQTCTRSEIPALRKRMKIPTEEVMHEAS